MNIHTNHVFKIKEHFPGVHSELARFCKILPANIIFSVCPFAGYVVNINVATCINWDLQDQKLCVVLVASKDDCTGGQLVLDEPGLVLDMKSSDIVIFPSHMHFKGKKASIVFHSDKKGKNWVVNHNGWLLSSGLMGGQEIR